MTRSTIPTAIGLIAAALLYGGCSPSPQKPGPGDYAPPFLEAENFGVRERMFSIPMMYDLTTGNNYDVGDMRTRFFSLTRETNLSADKYLGHINTKLLSWGYDMVVYDETGNVLATVDHRLGKSFFNFGGFVMDIKNPQGKTVGVLKQDPFAFWNSSLWKYFDVRDPSTGEVISRIECTSLMPDTYHVSNRKKTLDNRVLAGIVGILDQIEDEENDSDTDNDSSSDD
ncbi:MAG: hypothetical protein V1725_02645 [archaeon]